MTITDWFTDIGLLALVLLQLRSRKLGFLQLLLPVLLAGLAVWNYYTGWPTTANGEMLLAAGTLVGVLLGGSAAALTRVWDKDGVPFAKATVAAAGIWVFGMGVRLAFQIWANTSSGAANLTSFSVQHRIDAAAWIDALLIMAVAQVLVRTMVLYARGRTLRNRSAVTA